MAGFKLSEALIGRMADGMGVRPGSAMVAGIQQGQEQVQQRTDNRNNAELLEMKKQELVVKQKQYTDEQSRIATEDRLRQQQLDLRNNALANFNARTDVPLDVRKAVQTASDIGEDATAARLIEEYTVKDEYKTPPEIADLNLPKGTLMTKQGKLISTPDSATGNRDRVIDDTAQVLIRDYGLDPTEAKTKAQQIEDGQLKMTVSTDGKTTKLTNVVSETSETIVKKFEPLTAEEQIAPSDTFYAMANSPDGGLTGPKAAFDRAVGDLPIGNDYLSEDQDRATQYKSKLGLFSHNLKRSLALNERFAITEQELISQITDLVPKVLGSSEAMSARLRALSDSLKETSAWYAAESNNPGLDEKDREAYRHSVGAMNAAIAKIGAFDLEDVGSRQITPQEMEVISRTDLNRLVGLNDKDSISEKGFAWLEGQSPEVRTMIMEILSK